MMIRCHSVQDLLVHSVCIFSGLSNKNCLQNTIDQCWHISYKYTEVIQKENISTIFLYKKPGSNCKEAPCNLECCKTSDNCENLNTNLVKTW